MVMTISSSGPVLLQTREDDKTVVKPYGETCPKNTNFATKIADMNGIKLIFVVLLQIQL